VSFPFNSQSGLIIVQVELTGPTGNAILSLALDTGATATAINQGRLMRLGYDLALATDRVQITTGSGVEFVPRLSITRLKALGQERLNFPILAHTLPPSASVDGVLGLDFLRGHALAIDFRQAQLTLS